MATDSRRPLANCSSQPNFSLPPTKQATAAGSKRHISPEPSPGSVTVNPTIKRQRLADSYLAHKPREKPNDRKYIEREQQKAEFREKYTRAFPSFTFYFDELNTGSALLDTYEEMLEKLGAKTVRFLDKSVTHFISNRHNITFPPCAVDKENNIKQAHILKSPAKLKARSGEDLEKGGSAPNLSYKIWNTAKLESVLTRCLEPSTGTQSSRSSSGKRQPSSLARLLKSEQVHGTTERDPTQKRHDFKYFTRGAKFILIEDVRQELATIAAFEYPSCISREGTVANPPWPVLHCHPQARGPFIAFNEKEKRRWERLQKAEEQQKSRLRESCTTMKRIEIPRKIVEATTRFHCNGDLRRTVSMNNLHRGAKLQDTESLLAQDGEGGDPDSTTASGFLGAGNIGYMAASGNSVGITSTAGNTSTAGYTSNLQLSASINVHLKRVFTSRKSVSIIADKENKTPLMGPPTRIPEKQPILKKSRSTNTLKLPKREEGSKPGYCESCRVRFDNFHAHISGRKHQRFANDDANFLQLDSVLARVKRRTKENATETFNKRQGRCTRCCNHTDSVVGACSEESWYLSSTN